MTNQKSNKINFKKSLKEENGKNKMIISSVASNFTRQNKIVVFYYSN